MLAPKSAGILRHKISTRGLHGRLERDAFRQTLRRWIESVGPYLLASLLLVFGYVHYAEGTLYRLSPDHYRAWSFPALRYSDIIWLYLRDNLDQRPLPYIDFPLEYPPLTGVVSWLLGFAPDLPGYFTLAYLLLSVATLATLWALRRLPAANPWYFAAAPAIFFYTGHQWDPLAIGVTTLSLVALNRGHTRLGVTGLAVAVSLKLFPLAFLAALCCDQLRHRHWRRLVETMAIGTGVTLIANLPFALANPDGWSFFFRWNRDRLADSGLWVLWRGVPTETLTTASLILATGGGLAIAGYAYWRGGTAVLPLGATALLWWLAVNKTFTTHLMLWILLALAILRPPLWLWLAVLAVDLVGFQLGNYLNLYNVPDYQNVPLIRGAVEHLYDPLQIARSVILLGCVAWGLMVISRTRTEAPRYRTMGDAVWSPRIPRPRLTFPTLDRERVIAGAVLVGSFVGLTVVMTWPYALHLQDSTLVGFDPLLQIWLSRWVQHALATNPLGLWDANIFYPFPMTLAYTDANIPGALLAWPIDLLTRNPILTNSLLVLMTFVVAALGMFLLVHRLTGNRGAAWLAGIAYAFLPWRMIHLWHLNWLESAWLPYIALATLALLARPSVRRGLVLGSLVAIMTLTSFYFAVQIGFVVAAFLGAAMIADRRYRSRDTLKAGGIAALLALAAIGPAALPYIAVRDQLGLERTLAETEEYKATPGSYLSLPPWDRPVVIQQVLGIRSGENRSLTTVGQAPHADGHQHPEIVVEDALYPGLFAIIGTVLALLWWRQRQWPLLALGSVAIVAGVLSLGPSLEVAGGNRLPLPYGWLFAYAPGFTSMRVPARLGGLVGFALVAMAGIGVAASWERFGTALRLRLTRRLRRLVPLVATAGLGLLIAGDQIAVPIPLEPVAFDRTAQVPYVWLATEPPGPVMEFPAESIFADPAAASVRRHIGLSMLGSTLAWQPLVNGNSGFIPPSHSDLIERFVGNVTRDDGSLALRLSFVDSQRAKLLQALGVRYLLFHRDRYRPEDWAAVEAALAATEGVVESAAAFEHVTIYRVREAIDPAMPQMSLWAPTLLQPTDAWAPILTVQSDDLAPLALTRLTRLKVEWFDRDGRFMTRQEQQWPLPVTVDDGTLACTLTTCTAVSDNDLPADLPDPATGLWRPVQTGHYIATLTLSGDRPLACRVDLDVVDSTDQRGLTTAPPPRWAECVPSGTVPVNDPGGSRFAATPPSVTLVGDTIALQTGLAVQQPEEVKVWFLLALPGDPAPWRAAVYRSPVQQQLIAPDELATFSWIEVPATVAPGVYDLSVWVHHRVDGQWKHAAGGDYGMAPIVLGADGTIRWAGPIRITRLSPPPRFVVGATTRLVLGVSGESSKLRCQASWTLVHPASGTRQASGHSASCDHLEIRIPGPVQPGSYRLAITVAAVGAEQTRVSDGVVVPITVTGEAVPGTAH